MPNRILREGILTSERVDALSCPAEVFYRRLMSAVDDFGRFWGKPELLIAALYPLRLEKVRKADIVTWIGCACEAGLVRKYTVEGKDYLQLLDFRQQVRAKESKFPQPPSNCASEDTQMRSEREASAHLDVDVVVSEDVGEGGAERSRDVSRSAGSNGVGIVYIPLNDGSEYAVTQADVDELGSLYPALDVVQTLREIRGWNIANKAHRKTKGGVMRHVHRWFAKEQNKAP